MQPCDREYPTDVASGVPWMPTPGDDRPIQRVPSGLPGPGGIGWRFCAQFDLGGNHHGLRAFDTIEKRPRGVGNPRFPVPTRNVCMSRVPS